MDYVLNLGSTIKCSGMGVVSPSIQNPRVVPARVKVVGQAILTKNDLFPVAGCNNGNLPPCTPPWDWPVTMRRVTSGGIPVLHETSQGQCRTTLHTAAVIMNNQHRLRGT
jgi:hypothetical protein